MERPINISDGENYTVVSIGKLDDLEDHSLIHPKSGKEVKGKVFLKALTKATGTEISFQTLPPKTELPYFHSHRKNEETYIILKGSGNFQVDDSCFSIGEGSVVRVAPNGKRGLRNTSNQPMVYIVVQSKENSLEEYSTDDGDRVDCQPKWGT